MDLNSTARLDRWPFLLELIHHFLPDEQALVRELLDSVLCLLLEQVEAESPLNDGRLLHQESQMLVCFSGFVHPEVLLDYSSC